MMKVPGDENTTSRFWVYFSAGSDRVPFLEPSAESLDLDAYAWGLSDAHGIPALDFGPRSAREFLYGARGSADFGDTRFVFKNPKPNLCVRLDRDCRNIAVFGPALSAADLRGV